MSGRSIRRGLALAAVVALAATACEQVTVNQRAVYTSDPTVAVTGSVLARGSDPLVAVDVNGVAATLDGTNWSAVVPIGSTDVFVPLLATARFGSGFSEVQRSTVARAGGSVALVPKGQTNAGSIVTQLQPSALTKLAPVILPAVVFDPSVFAVPRSSAGTSQASITYQTTRGSVRTTPPTLSLDVSTGVLRSIVTYPDVNQTVHVDEILFGASFSCDMTFDVADVGVATTYALAAIAGGVSATPQSTTSGTGPVTFSGCSMASDFYPQMQANVVDDVRLDLTNALRTPDSGESPLQAGIEQQLAGLAFAGPVGGTGSGVTLGVPQTAIGATTNGIGLADDTMYQSSGPAAGATPQSSSLAFGPVAAPGPDLTGTYDVAVGLSTAAVNQLLAAVTERGELNTTVTTRGVDPLTFDSLDQSVSIGPPIDPDRALKVTVVPELAPAITDAAGPAGAVGVVHLGGWRATITFVDTGEVLLDAVFDADGTARLQVANGSLSVAGTNLTASRVDLIANPRNLSTSQTNAVIAVLLSDIAGPLSGGVALGPAPALGGHTFTATGTARSGSGLFVYGTLG